MSLSGSQREKRRAELLRLLARSPGPRRAPCFRAARRKRPSRQSVSQSVSEPASRDPSSSFCCCCYPFCLSVLSLVARSRCLQTRTGWGGTTALRKLPYSNRRARPLTLPLPHAPPPPPSPCSPSPPPRAPSSTSTGRPISGELSEPPPMISRPANQRLSSAACPLARLTHSGSPLIGRLFIGVYICRVTGSVLAVLLFLSAACVLATDSACEPKPSCFLSPPLLSPSVENISSLCKLVASSNTRCLELFCKR